MLAIYKRELRSYFTSMTGYLFIAVVVFFIGIYFMANNLYYGDPGFSTTLVHVMVVLLVAVPVLTMRSMAEERRSRTDQLLLTAPVSVSGVVMGKYLAMVTILAIPKLLTAQTQAEADAAAQAEEAESETAEDTSVETDSAAETTDSPAETDSGAE